MRAFHIPSSPGSSSLSYFSGQKRPAKHYIKPKRWEIPDEDDSSDWAQEQRARLKRSRQGHNQLHATETRPPGFSRPPLPEWTAIAGRVRQAIASLPDLERDWIHFSYRPDGATQVEAALRFQREFFNHYAAHHLKGSKGRTVRIVNHLVGVAMINERSPGARLYPEVDPEDRRSWNRTYRPHFFQIRVDLAEVDRRACGRIGGNIAELPEFA